MDVACSSAGGVLSSKHKGIPFTVQGMYDCVIPLV